MRELTRMSACAKKNGELKATGLYGLAVALVLSEREEIELMVANSRAVRHFAQAMMQRSKNDRLDAKILREFAARMPFRRWVRPSANTLALWAIARRLEVLTRQRTAGKKPSACRTGFASGAGGRAAGNCTQPARVGTSHAEAASRGIALRSAGPATAAALSAAMQYSWSGDRERDSVAERIGLAA